ncbi:hypothetical protein M409DRAFT_20214 [Zasmidium cellare ATCC 36951]|uniref:Uncharacterized protein n=1 Tax=Zasmidium cellare ATCC 36951 TaxID=1080233 RepID=A0A6A6CVH0_ZASCE|nr:uncharacterized protein M409DRAFT_20214 [Zasmidium cellare ATCC 36951]KAF2169799.1 hypothetical protein M409DRAFT_20214 [Zasmidium cellare ATCC 36951]
MAEPTLLGLPKELREQIYLLTLPPQHPTNAKRPYPREPPLLQVSHFLRQETLPLFYANTPLSTHTTIDRTSYNKPVLRYYPWWHHFPPTRFQHIKQFDLQFDFLERYFGEPVTITFTIKLMRGVHFEIEHRFKEGWWRDPNRRGDPKDCEEVIEVLKGHFGSVLTGLLQPGGAVKLSADDLDRLLEVDTDTLP